MKNIYGSVDDNQRGWPEHLTLRRAEQAYLASGERSQAESAGARNPRNIRPFSRIYYSPQRQVRNFAASCRRAAASLATSTKANERHESNRAQNERVLRGG